MYVHIFERDTAREVLRHHHHAGDPEEDDVKTGNQHTGWQVAFQHGVWRIRPIRCPVQR